MRPATANSTRNERIVRRLLSREGIEMVSTVISAVISAICAPFLGAFLTGLFATCVSTIFSSYVELLLASFEAEGTLFEFSSLSSVFRA